MTINEVEDYKSGIYEIRNLVNGKRYVGSAVNIEKRWKEHLRRLDLGTHHSVKLQRSWDKWGASNFEFATLERVDNREHLVLIEQVWMDWFNVVDNGYNICRMAESSLGYKHTAASRAKISAARIGKPCPTKGIKRKPLTQEHRAKLSAAGMGRPSHNKGKQHLPETIEKLRVSCTGWSHTQEAKDKIAAAKLGVPRTDEAKQKMKDAWVKRRLKLEAAKLKDGS